MKATRILLTGGSGRLGVELQKLRSFDAPSKFDLDIAQDIVRHNYDLIIHAAAYTDVDKAETDQWNCISVNVGGTARLVNAYRNTPFVYISTEHAFRPLGIYFASKLAAEEVIKAQHNNYLIIRTLFKQRPWLYDNAWADQITQGDYTDVIAKLILEAVDAWEGNSKSMYIGTGRKSIYELAKQTKKDVIPSSRLDHQGACRRPADYE